MKVLLITLLATAASGLAGWLITRAVQKDRLAKPAPLENGKFVLKPKTNIIWGALVPMNLGFLIFGLIAIGLKAYVLLAFVVLLIGLLNYNVLRKLKYQLSISEDGIITYKNWNTSEVVIHQEEIKDIQFYYFGRGLQISTNDDRKAFVLTDLRNSPHILRFIKKAWPDKLSPGAKKAIRKTIDPKPWDHFGV